MNTYPEVRQCQIPGHPLEGAVAVKAEPAPDVVMWGVFHPVSSGRWLTEPDVEGWAVATSWEVPVTEPPAPEPEPDPAPEPDPDIPPEEES